MKKSGDSLSRVNDINNIKCNESNVNDVRIVNVSECYDLYAVGAGVVFGKLYHITKPSIYVFCDDITTLNKYELNLENLTLNSDTEDYININNLKDYDEIVFITEYDDRINSNLLLFCKNLNIPVTIFTHIHIEDEDMYKEFGTLAHFPK